MKTLRENQNRSPFLSLDVAAVLLGAGLFFYFLFTARYTEIDIDEPAYYAIPQRILLGDSLIVDEWSPAQFALLVDLFPYWVFTRITGGTEGLLYFMRVVFITVDVVFFFYLYKKLRSYRGWGLAGAFLFCALVPQTILGLYYFPVSAMATAVVCAALFVDEKEKSVVRLIIIGGVMGIGIMAEPFLIVLFLTWLVLTFLRERNARRGRPFLDAYAFALNGKTFLFTAAGAALDFTIFVIVLAATGSFRGLEGALPYLFSGDTYNAGKLTDLSKIGKAAQFYGYLPLILLALCLCCAIVLRMRKTRSARARNVLFFASCSCLMLCLLFTGIRTAAHNEWKNIYGFLAYHDVPLLLFAPVPFLLSNKKNERFTLFLLVGVGYSVLVDVSSRTLLGSGGNLVRIALALQLPVFLPTLKEGSPAVGSKGKAASRENGRFRKARRAVVAAVTACVLGWNAGYVWIEGMEKGLTEVKKDPAECEITTGPYRHMKMPSYEAEIYYDTLKDLDLIREGADGGRVCILDTSSYMYLYLDLPYATYTSYFDGDFQRQALYWGLSPQHVPDWIYIPCYEFFFFQRVEEELVQNKIRETFRYVDGEITEGRAGYLIRVSSLVSGQENR